jgi:hypothetical protein
VERSFGMCRPTRCWRRWCRSTTGASPGVRASRVTRIAGWVWLAGWSRSCRSSRSGWCATTIRGAVREPVLPIVNCCRRRTRASGAVGWCWKCAAMVRWRFGSGGVTWTTDGSRQQRVRRGRSGPPRRSRTHDLGQGRERTSLHPITRGGSVWETGPRHPREEDIAIGGELRTLLSGPDTPVLAACRNRGHPLPWCP